MAIDSWVDFFDGQEAAMPGRCIPPPLGCGEPLTGFTDKVSEDEYRITGLCQQCQDGLMAYAEEMEKLGVAWDKEEE